VVRRGPNRQSSRRILTTHILEKVNIFISNMFTSFRWSFCSGICSSSVEKYIFLHVDMKDSESCPQNPICMCLHLLTSLWEEKYRYMLAQVAVLCCTRIGVVFWIFNSYELFPVTSFAAICNVLSALPRLRMCDKHRQHGASCKGRQQIDRRPGTRGSEAVIFDFLIVPGFDDIRYFWHGILVILHPVDSIHPVCPIGSVSKTSTPGLRFYCVYELRCRSWTIRM
jgi:hypothetical protein